MRTFVPLFVLGVLGVLSSACEYAKSPVRPSTLDQSAFSSPSERRYPADGPAVIAYVVDRYPDRLRGGISHGERLGNMEFLRDRIIETGVCGGMRLARNLKRGVGPHSVDAIVLQTGDDNRLDVIDLALDYDNASAPLQLQWIVVDGPAGWDPLPSVSCP